MGFLLGFAPFLAFAVMTRYAAPALCLWTAAAIAAILMLNELRHRRSLKVLEAGTVVLFAALGTYTAITHSHWAVPTIRWVIDAGLLLIVLLSLMLRRPFTLQYAREQVSPAVAQSPIFVRTNYTITAVWATAMAVIVAADLAQNSLASLPNWMGSAVGVVALVAAFRFTTWYPKHLRTRKDAARSRA